MHKETLRIATFRCPSTTTTRTTFYMRREVAIRCLGMLFAGGAREPGITVGLAFSFFSFLFSFTGILRICIKRTHITNHT